MLLQRLVSGDQYADPGAAGAKPLGDGIDKDQVLIQIPIGAHALQGLVPIDELPVDLVGNEEQAVLFRDVRDHAHLLRGQHHAGGIAGVADHDRPGPGSDQGLDPFPVRIVISLFRGGWDGDDLSAGAVDKGIVIGIEGLRDQDLVIRVQYAAQGNLQGFAAAGGHQNVPFPIIDADAGIVPLNRLDQLRNAGAGGIF